MIEPNARWEELDPRFTARHLPGKKLESFLSFDILIVNPSPALATDSARYHLNVYSAEG